MIRHGSAVALAAACCVLGFLDPAQADANAFASNSAWSGTMQQGDPKASYSFFLFVKHVNGTAFEGTTWYPTLGNGLLRVSGQVHANGTVTFVEEEVVHAGPLADGRLLVVAGSSYSGTVEGSTLNGVGTMIGYIDPQSKQEVPLKQADTMAFTLRLAN